MLLVQTSNTFPLLSWQGDGNSRPAMALLEDVERMLVGASGLKAKLELIDCIKKMGLASLFDKEISEALEGVALMELKEEILNDNHDLHQDENIEEEDLYTTALCFRLLRQHGHEVSRGRHIYTCRENDIYYDVGHMHAHVQGNKTKMFIRTMHRFCYLMGLIKKNVIL